VSCNGDPTSDFRGGPSQILADPSTVFLDQGNVEEVVVTLVDNQGDPLPGTWEIAEPGSGISVERNPDFLGTTVGAPLESQAQFIVTAGDAPVGTSFTLASGELSLEIPVNVLPPSIATAAFSNATPALNEPVTLTAEGYTFLPDAFVVTGDTAALLSNDGSAITFIPTPGFTGPALVANITLPFLPTTPLTLPTEAEITVPAVSQVPGTEDPATAPALTAPPVGGQSSFFDLPDFAATADHWYELTVTEAGVYTVTMDWDIGDDIDMILCNADLSICDGQAATGDHPEVGEYDLAPGTYLILANDFGQDPICVAAGCVPAIGAQLEIFVQNAGTSGGLRSPSSTVRKSPLSTVRKTRK
jgi:hypothetical protein